MKMWRRYVLLEEHKEKIANLNTSDISMPYTLKTIDIINNTVIEEEIPNDVIDVIEENKNEEQFLRFFYLNDTFSIKSA